MWYHGAGESTSSTLYIILSPRVHATNSLRSQLTAVKRSTVSTASGSSFKNLGYLALKYL